MIPEKEMEHAAARHYEQYDPEKMAAFVLGAGWMQDRVLTNTKPDPSPCLTIEQVRKDNDTQKKLAAVDADKFGIGFLVNGVCVEPSHVIQFFPVPSGDGQGKEFNCVENLSRAYQQIQQTAIVDDDYPAVRHRYEAALHAFLRACKDNGRKLAWLCYDYDGDVVIVFKEPDRRCNGYERIVPIVYAVLEE